MLPAPRRTHRLRRGRARGFSHRALGVSSCSSWLPTRFQLVWRQILSAWAAHRAGSEYKTRLSSAREPPGHCPGRACSSAALVTAGPLCLDPAVYEMFIPLQPLLAGDGSPPFIWPIEHETMGRGTWAMLESWYMLAPWTKGDLMKHSRNHGPGAILLKYSFWSWISPNMLLGHSILVGLLHSAASWSCS